MNSELALAGYSVVNIIGRGGFGEVYLVDRWGDRKKLAVKSVLGDKYGQREKGVMPALRHRNIIKLVAFREKELQSKVRYYFVVEYFKHGSLHDYLKRATTVEEDQILVWFEQIATGLEYMHDAEYIHRDLTPKNVLLADNLMIKIADFGLSRMLDPYGKMTTKVGTPFYAAPEYCQAYDRPSDVWGIGICVLEAVIKGNWSVLKMNDGESLRELFKQDKDMLRNRVPNELFKSTEFRELLLSLLREDPALRPTAKQVVTEVCELRRQTVPHSLVVSDEAEENAAVELEKLQVKDELNSSGAVSFEDAAKGSFFGALLGNAVGASAQLNNGQRWTRISEKDVDDAFAFRKPEYASADGKPQCSDDGELTITSLMALGDQLTESNEYSLEQHASRYKWWLDGCRGVGETTRMGLSPLNCDVDPVRESYSAVAQSDESQSNGALMRACALGIFGHQLVRVQDGRVDSSKLCKLVSFDVHFTHKSELVHVAVISYCMAIALLCQKPGQRKFALETVKQWLLEHASINRIVKVGSGEMLTFYDFFDRHIMVKSNGDLEVDGLVNDADLLEGRPFGSRVDVQGAQQTKWVMFAYTIAFRHLRRGSTWLDAVRATVRLGGDADTNGIVVGALLGCADGISQIDVNLLQKLMQMDPSTLQDQHLVKAASKRQEFAGRNLLPYIEKMLQKVPKNSEEFKFADALNNLAADFFSHLVHLHN